MAKCPVCGHDVPTSFFLDLKGWRHTCPHCAARLERKGPRSMALVPLMIGLIALGQQDGHRFAVMAMVLMLAIVILILLESILRPQFQLRKALPEPEIRLNINNPPN